MSPQSLLEQARAGDSMSLGQLMELHRVYLRILANQEIGRQLQGKVGASDIVQEVFLKAHRQFSGFEGTQVYQFEKWLRTILAGTLANTVRHYFGTQARNPQLEREMLFRFDQSTCALSQIIADPQSSPSQQAQRVEMGSIVAKAIGQLPQDYQDVLMMRHVEGLTFPQIAQRMERSVDSVEKLWLRGITSLRRQFTGQFS